MVCYVLFSNQKSPQHQSGSVYATSHRLFYIDNAHSRSRSFALDLSQIDRTDYYAGLLRSSAKITLYLAAAVAGSSKSSSRQSQDNNNFDVWECEVCSYRNGPGLSPTASSVCGLCGVPRSTPQSSANSTAARTRQHHVVPLSSSLPSSSEHLHMFSSSAPSSRDDPESTSETEIACPACTFLNHPSLPACEICGTALPRPLTRQRPAAMTKSAPASRPPSDDEDDEDDMYAVGDGTPRMIKVSFRKGGDKNFYAILRRGLLAKAWEVSEPTFISVASNEIRCV